MEETCAYSKTKPNSQNSEMDQYSDSLNNASDASDSAMQAIKSRKRAAPHSHRLSNKRRRDNQINKRLRALRDLIPNCTQRDKESVLDEAIVYLKCLQLQLQIMPTFAGLCLPPPPITYPIDLRLGAAPLHFFGLPLPGYGTMPPPVRSPNQP